MTDLLTLSLACCGHVHLARCNSAAIGRGEPNERKKNVICPGCGSLVIMTLRTDSSEVLVEHQEVIGLPSDR